MRTGAPKGDVQIMSALEERGLGPPRLPMLIAAGVLAVVSAAVTFGSHGGSDDIEASIITDPALRPEPAVSTTISPDFADPLPPVAVPNPIDAHVPGFTGTLVMTAASEAGLELWTWKGGPDGTLRRDPVAGELLDARLDIGGDEVAAIRGRANDDHWLIVTDGSDVVPVSFGAQSFAWHSTDPGRIAWLSQTSNAEAPTLYVGSRDDGGLYFKPLASLAGRNTLTINRPPDRIVGYDDAGFVVETWPIENGVIISRVERLDAGGSPLSSVTGYFVGISPSGGLVVADTGSPLGMPSASAVWSPDGRYVATTSDGSTLLRIQSDDASTPTTFDLRLDDLIAHAWSPDGRFLVVSGMAGQDPVLVFVDTADGTIRPLPIDARPIAVVVIP